MRPTSRKSSSPKSNPREAAWEYFPYAVPSVMSQEAVRLACGAKALNRPSLGAITIGIFLWLLSVLALLGILTVVFLLVFSRSLSVNLTDVSAARDSSRCSQTASSAQEVHFLDETAAQVISRCDTSQGTY